MRRSLFVLSVTVALMLTWIAGVRAASRWDQVPAKDRDRTNPLTRGSRAVNTGAALYMDHCAQCHGADALGDGKKKPSLKTEGIRSATDGDLEWFLRHGDLRHGMPSWSSLPTAQRWQIIAYLRSIQPE